MGEYRMPSLGADMESGVLVQWMVKPGDAVKRGDIIAVIGTDKADVEAEVFESGVIEELVAKPGEKLPVGSVLARIATVGEAPAAPAPPAPAKRAERQRASPLARKLAQELGVDLAAIRGTGPEGAIERHDVEAAAAAKGSRPLQPAVPPAEPKVAEISGMRQAIAAAMARSNREIPHYYLETSIDMKAALAWLENSNSRRALADRILPPALLLKAVARALGEVPELNGYWVDGQPKRSAAIHLGVAVALRQGGLIVPAIHDAEKKSLEQIMESLRDCIVRARSGRLRASDLTDSTITVTNLGDLGVESVCGVIYPPQVALVGFGKILDRPWAVDGMLGVRPILKATIAGDHRASDGRSGARFLDTLDKLLQKPEQL